MVRDITILSLVWYGRRCTMRDKYLCNRMMGGGGGGAGLVSEVLYMFVCVVHNPNPMVCIKLCMRYFQ